MQAPGAPDEDRSGGFAQGGWMAPFADEDLGLLVTALKREGTGEVQVHGSPGLAQTLIANDLVDEYRLWVHPVVLGSGKRLFGTGDVPAASRLTATKTTSTGVVVHAYERAGAPRHGAFSVDEQTSTGRLFKGEFSGRS